MPYFECNSEDGLHHLNLCAFWIRSVAKFLLYGHNFLCSLEPTQRMQLLRCGGKSGFILWPVGPFACCKTGKVLGKKASHCGKGKI